MTPALLIGIPAFFALLMPLFALMKNIEPRFLVVLFCLFLLLFPLGMLDDLQEGGVIIQRIRLFFLFNFTFSMGFLELLFVALFSLIALIIAMYGISTQPSTTTPKEELYQSIAFLFALSGSFGMLLSNDIGNLLLFCLCTDFALYILIKKALNTQNLKHIYLRSNAISALFMILGVITLYLLLGETNMYYFAQKLPAANGAGIYLAAGFLLLSFAIKSELFPFNLWVAPVYENGDMHHITLFTAITTKAHFIALIQLLGIFFTLSPLFGHALIAIGGISMLLASLTMLLKEDSLRRILARSGVVQIGLITMTLGFNLAKLNEGVFFYLINHSLAFALIYLSVGYLMRSLGSDRLSTLRGCALSMPVSALFFTLGAMSLVGFPPFLGFLSKLLILKGFADYQLFLPILAIFIASLCESVLYLRIISILYAHKAATATPNTPNLTHLPMIILGAILLVLGFIPSILFLLVGGGAEEFMQGKILLPTGIKAFQ